jgi:hypothetical protein
MVTVIDVDGLRLVQNIPVTLTPDGQTGRDLFHTLQVPIQTPVSPDEKWVATAVLSLTTIPRSTTGEPDHVAIIDTDTNRVVAFVPTPAGTHGVNWGAKLGGGYYAYVTNQHANVLTVIDPDPNGDGDGRDARVVGTILLANGSSGAGATDGTGGQGVKPLPMTHDGWIQKTVALAGTGGLSAEVEGWIARLTPAQRDPHGGGIHLAVDPLVAGQPFSIRTEHARPGEAVYTLLSLTGVGPGPCIPALGGLCLDVLPPLVILGPAVANAAGEAELPLFLPGGVPPGIAAHFQSLIARGATGAESVKSNVATRTTQ